MHIKKIFKIFRCKNKEDWIVLKFFWGLIRISFKRKIKQAPTEQDPWISVRDTDPVPVYILKDFGGDFKQYIFENNMPKIIAKLKDGFDEESIKIIDRKVEEFLNLPNKWFNNNLIFGMGYRSFLNEAELQEQEKWFKYEKQYLTNKYPLVDPIQINQESFKYHCGLKKSPDEVIEYIKGKNFIDIGAYVGDSAIVLNEYSPNKMYLIEGFDSATEEMKINLQKNNINPEKYEIYKCLIGAENKKINIGDNRNMVSLYQDGKDVKKVDMYTLDTFIKKFDIENIGLIKMDIEGAEFDVLKSGIESIKKFRPVIITAIYHNPKQFFELKPFLAENLENYIFKVFDINTLWMHRETRLLAYPKEIVK